MKQAESTDRAPSIMECSFYARRDTEARDFHTKILKSQNFFPVLKNTEFAKLSVNYLLYFEFYHMAIRMLLGIFLVSVIGYATYHIVVPLTHKEYQDIISPIIIIAFILFTSIIVVILRHSEFKRIRNNPILHQYLWTEDLFSLMVKQLPTSTTKDEIIDYFNMIVDDLQISGAVKYILVLQDYRLYIQLKTKLLTINTNLEKLTEKGLAKKN